MLTTGFTWDKPGERIETIAVNLNYARFMTHEELTPKCYALYFAYVDYGW